MTVPTMFPEIVNASSSSSTRAFMNDTVYLIMNEWQLGPGWTMDKWNRHATDVAKQLASKPYGYRSVHLVNCMTCCVQTSKAAAFGLPIPDPAKDNARGSLEPDNLRFETNRLAWFTQRCAERGVTIEQAYFDTAELTSAWKTPVYAAGVKLAMTRSLFKNIVRDIIDADQVYPVGDDDSNGAPLVYDTRPANTSCPWFGLWISGREGTLPSLGDRRWATFVRDISRLRMRAAFAARNPTVSDRCVIGFTSRSQQSLGKQWDDRSWNAARAFFVAHALRTWGVAWHVFNEIGFGFDGTPDAAVNSPEAAAIRAREEDAMADLFAQHWRFATNALVPSNLPSLHPYAVNAAGATIPNGRDGGPTLIDSVTTNGYVTTREQFDAACGNVG